MPALRQLYRQGRCRCARAPAAVTRGLSASAAPELTTGTQPSHLRHPPLDAQNELARSEGYNIAATCHQYLTVKDGTPLRGLIMDHVDAGTKLTMRGTLLTRAEYNQLVYIACCDLAGAVQGRARGRGGGGRRQGERESERVRQRSRRAGGPGDELVWPELGPPVPGVVAPLTCVCSAGSARAPRAGKGNDQIIELQPPAVLKPEPRWTGKQVITTLMRHLTKGKVGLGLTASARTPSKVWANKGARLDEDMEDQQVLFVDGRMLKGVLDKSAFGASALWSSRAAPAAANPRAALAWSSHHPSRHARAAPHPRSPRAATRPAPPRPALVASPQARPRSASCTRCSSCTGRTPRPTC